MTIKLDDYKSQDDPTIKVKLGRHESSISLNKTGFRGWLTSFIAQNALKSAMIISIFAILTTLGITQAKKLSFAWAEINTGNFDSGFSILWDSFDKESKYIASGNHPYFKELEKSDEFEEFKDEFGEDKKYSDVFFYAGNGLFMMRDVVKIQNEVAVGATGEEAKDYCEKIGARLPKHEELKTISGSKNPLFIKRFKKRKVFPELTSTVSSKDSDDYVVFVKSKSNAKKLTDKNNTNYIEQLYERKGVYYLDEDNGSGNLIMSFRCAIWKK